MPSDLSGRAPLYSLHRYFLPLQLYLQENVSPTCWVIIASGQSVLGPKPSPRDSGLYLQKQFTRGLENNPAPS